MVPEIYICYIKTTFFVQTGLTIFKLYKSTSDKSQLKT